MIKFYYTSYLKNLKLYTKFKECKSNIVKNVRATQKIHISKESTEPSMLPQSHCWCAT